MSEPKTEARLSPESFTRGPDVSSSLGTHQPPLSQGPSGNTYVDQGGICEGRSDGGCVLDDKQRARLSQLFFGRMTSAENNYKHAIERLRVDELLKKDEDGSWLVLLILDVVSFHLASSFKNGLMALKTDALAQIDQMGARLALRFEEVPLRAQLSRDALKLAGPDEIKGVVKFAVDGAAKATASVTKAAPQGKAANVSYLAKLQSDAGIGFQAVREGLPATLNDLEMIAVTDSLDAAQQTVEMFATVLSAKLSRFESSGVTKIGSSLAWRDVGSPDHGMIRQQVVRDTRVVWLVAGGRLELRYEFHDGEYDPSHGPPGMLGLEDDRRTFGPPDKLTSSPTLGAVVPAEFIKTAIARHEAVWGGPPPTVTVPAGVTWFDMNGDGIWDSAQVSGAKPKVVPTVPPPASPVVKPGDPADIFLRSP